MTKYSKHPKAELTIRQRVFNHLTTLPSDFTVHDFECLEIPNNNVSVALREIAKKEKIHICDMAMHKGRAQLCVYRHGPKPGANTVTDIGLREVFPWMFTPTALPSGTLRNVRLLTRGD